MDVLRKLEEAKSYGLSKDEYFHLLEMELKLMDANKSNQMTNKSANNDSPYLNSVLQDIRTDQEEHKKTLNLVIQKQGKLEHNLQQFFSQQESHMTELDQSLTWKLDSTLEQIQGCLRAILQQIQDEHSELKTSLINDAERSKCFVRDKLNTVQDVKMSVLSKFEDEKKYLKDKFRQAQSEIFNRVVGKSLDGTQFCEDQGRELSEQRTIISKLQNKKYPDRLSGLQNNHIQSQSDAERQKRQSIPDLNNSSSYSSFFGIIEADENRHERDESIVDNALQEIEKKETQRIHGVEEEMVGALTSAVGTGVLNIDERSIKDEGNMDATIAAYEVGEKVSKNVRPESDSGTYVSLLGRHVLDTGRQVSEPGRQVPEGRQVSDFGRQLSDSGRKVLETVDHVTDSGGYVSQLDDQVALPGRVASHSGGQVTDAPEDGSNLPGQDQSSDSLKSELDKKLVEKAVSLTVFDMKTLVGQSTEIIIEAMELAKQEHLKVVYDFMTMFKYEIFEVVEKEAQLIRDRMVNSSKPRNSYVCDFYVKFARELIRFSDSSLSPPWHIDQLRSCVKGYVEATTGGDLYVALIYGRQPQTVGLQPRSGCKLKVKATVKDTSGCLPDVVVGDVMWSCDEAGIRNNRAWGKKIGVLSCGQLVANGYSNMEGYSCRSLLIRYEIHVV
ncbi:uncharacterized protein LOC131947487 [Physella acuta]|uniref:uncharacterized protein LOC131947487 n=1 Tax=Physella acuta TaxID=109671 RepID=UPI0027DCE2E2|nr:uncharacterized protein LOC131947487 [Physella acuta]